MKGDWEDWSGFPDGGIDTRKYAALMCALGRARGSLSAAMEVEGVRETLDCTFLVCDRESVGP